MKNRVINTASLRSRLLEQIKSRILSDEWPAGARLPSEHELSEEYGVSRVTVRSVLQLLETQRLTYTRHGVGSFVSFHGPAITAGLQELRSISDTVRAHGMTPTIRYRSADVRSAYDAERISLELKDADAMVFSTEREILANGSVIAYSKESIPTTVFPDGFDYSSPVGSLFELLEMLGSSPQTAVAKIRPAVGTEIGWSAIPVPADDLFIHLHQVHFVNESRPVLLSSTYFRDDSFQFQLLRTR